MPREGAIIFRDIVGKLDVLTVERDKCGRFGRYHVDRLIERYGIDAKLFDWSPRSIVRALWRVMRTTRAARGARNCQRWCETPLRNEARVHYQRPGRARCE
jgi:DNA polymerase III epsilon subunit-like protein